jgi:hypothetical protein
VSFTRLVSVFILLLLVGGPRTVGLSGLFVYRVPRVRCVTPQPPLKSRRRHEAAAVRGEEEP